MVVLRKQDATKFEPGSRYEYSNSGYAVLAQIVEKVSGMSFAGFLKKNIFDVLGMKGRVVHEEGTSVVRNRAYGYSKRLFNRLGVDPSSIAFQIADQYL